MEEKNIETSSPKTDSNVTPTQEVTLKTEVEDLEWEFKIESYRDDLEFSHGNRYVMNVGESGTLNSALIKLKNKTINNDGEYCITLKSEINDDDIVYVGVTDSDWSNAICYDNEYETFDHVKKYHEKLKCGDEIVIKDKYIAKIDNRNRVHLVSILKNGNEIFATYYTHEQKKELELGIGGKVQVEVEVKDTPEEAIILSNNLRGESSIEAKNNLKQIFELTKQVRKVSFMHYNDNVPTYVNFHFALKTVVQYWIKIFDNYPSQILFDFFNSHNEQIHFREILSFLIMISSYEKSLLIKVLDIFNQKQITLLEFHFDSNAPISDGMINTISNAVQDMQRFVLQFKAEHFFTLFDLICVNCDSIYTIIRNSNSSKTNEVTSNLIYLHSILNDELFIRLMMDKSGKDTPLDGKIHGNKWLVCVIEAQMTSIISFLLKEKQDLIINIINDRYENSTEISRSMMSLILDKTDNFSVLRREFFGILTSNFKKCSKDAIDYVKENCSETSNVTIKAVEEIKAQYNFTSTEKFSILGSLLVAFILGSVFYGLDIGYDYALLNQCSINKNCTRTCNSKNIKFEEYFEYTLTVCLLPFILNFVLIGIDIRRNKWNCILLLPYNVAKHYCEQRHSDFMDYRLRDRPLQYHFSLLFTLILWIPFTISLYPIATKIAFSFLDYKIIVMTRSLSTTKNTDLNLTVTNDFFKNIQRTVTSEMIKSSILEVVTEATFQPLLQLYSLTCGDSDSLYKDLISKSFYNNPQVVSVITSIFSFSWSICGYHVYFKRGALDFGVGLKARIMLLIYVLLYICSRMLILSIAANQVFLTYENFLTFVLIHLLVMSCVHVFDLKSKNVLINLQSMDFWLEVFVNGSGSILLPSNIKFPRIGKESILNERFHEPTSKRYVMMHFIILIENVVLAIWSWYNLQENNEAAFVIYYPQIVLGIFFSSLVFKFLYYQIHAWPISPTNCLTSQSFHLKKKETGELEAILLLPIEKTPANNTESNLLKTLNPRVNDAQAPLPSQLSATDESPYIIIKSPNCCKYNYAKAIHDFLNHKISEEEGDSDSSGDNAVKKCSLSNCCNYNSSEIKLVDKYQRPVNWGLARASHPIPSTCNLYYFEVKILNDGKTKEIEIGVLDGDMAGLDFTENFGYDWDGIGYRGNDGKLYVSTYGEKMETIYAYREYGETFGKDDVIGCGINVKTNCFFFTKNGDLIGLINFHKHNHKWKLFPAVRLHAKNAKVEANFGEDRFLFDVCKTRYSIEAKLTLDTCRYEDFLEDLELEELDEIWLIFKSSIKIAISTVLDVPEEFVDCKIQDFYKWEEGKYTRKEDDVYFVRLLKVYREEEKDEINKICDVMNSNSFLADVNSEIRKFEKLADGKFTVKNSTTPSVKVLTGSYEQLCSNLSPEEAEEIIGADVESKTSDLETNELLPLPDGWREVETKEGQLIYIDDISKKIQWNRPKPDDVEAGH